MPFQRTWLVFRGDTRRRSEQQKQAGKPRHHFDVPRMGHGSGQVVMIVTPASFEHSTAKNGSRPEGAVSTERQSPYPSSSATRVTTLPHCRHRKDVSSGCGPNLGSLRCNFMTPPHASQRGGANWTFGRGCILLRPAQCDIRTGIVMEARISRVIPPRMNSRSREWP